MADHHQNLPGVPDEPASSLARPLLEGLAARLRGETSTRGLPVARMVSPPGRCSTNYVITSIDDRGRLADRSPVRVMQWAPGQPVGIASYPEAVVITANHPQPTSTVNRRGQLWLPTGLRRTLRLEPSDRLLVVACPDAAFVAVFAIVVLDQMILAWLGEPTNEATR